ncbi:MAG: AzlD domain-containing protein [Ilumatobacteraceae bacterium]
MSSVSTGMVSMALVASAGPIYMAVGIVGLALVTVLTRASFFMLPARFELPSTVERALRYAPSCALVAIIVPSILSRHGEVFISVRNYQMWSVIVGTLVFLRFRNMLSLMVVVMGMFTALRLLA